MPSLDLKNLSPFGQLAVKLDNDFSELSRLGGQIQRLDIHSDSGLEHALKLLNQFAQRGQAIAEAVQEFSQRLQEAHQQTEAVTQAVAERAQVILQRRQQQNQIQEKLAGVEQALKASSEKLVGFRDLKKNGFSDQDKRQLTTALGQLQGELDTFAADAESIKQEASAHQFKRLERSAQSLLDTLQASRRKIEKAIAG